MMVMVLFMGKCQQIWKVGFCLLPLYAGIIEVLIDKCWPHKFSNLTFCKFSTFSVPPRPSNGTYPKHSSIKSEKKKSNPAERP